MGSQVKLNNKPIVTCSEQDNRPTLNTSIKCKKIIVQSFEWYFPSLIDCRIELTYTDGLSREFCPCKAPYICVGTGVLRIPPTAEYGKKISDSIW